mmetsp:Transcript_25948/g.38334  ORF Transcript_25948/g.38334 Transcript_25948/m.38334 type:complete len:303 (+) Transcript_25948:190-1098(+)|eukprot:CAMPEP_0194221652 /NCGR_PEP_ID=MMETSP0156-20130528/31051_1 /TAXON_ID=33649 /ORGANISM="Thalassionema nitzschioides, Strain L26-B" /LENGTH=302 /DNA_ID=CAMNT_0038952127 /DNA_START=178 /DNA_END=1086 /DNA_ORIENTATION=-
MTSIPVIDISPYLDGTDKQGVAKQIGDTCTSIGFFMVKGHGIPLKLLSDVQEEATDFFDLPLKEKRASKAPFGLGYMGQGTENVAATLKEGSTLQDQKESLNLTLPVREDIWPQEPPRLRSVCETYYQSVQTLASQLMRLFALALDLDENFFDEKINRPYTTLRLLNYPESSAQKPSDTEIRNAEHTDYGTLTILWSPDSRGLQAQSRQKEWIDVIAPEDHFIINIGDLMMNWTNDKWISTLHRVIPGNKRRMSIPFFHNPNPDAIIECICNGEKPKYEPVLAKTHLEMKVSKALGQEEKMN